MEEQKMPAKGRMHLSGEKWEDKRNSERSGSWSGCQDAKSHAQGGRDEEAETEEEEAEGGREIQTCLVACFVFVIIKYKWYNCINCKDQYHRQYPSLISNRALP